MTDFDIKRSLANRELTPFMNIDDYFATRDLLVRVVIECCLVLLCFYFLKNDFLIIGCATFYLLAVWHSFWGYAGLAHELMHGRVFSSRRLNSILFSLCSFLVWSNPAFFKKTHTFHHKHTFHPDDSESNTIQSWKFHRILIYITIDFFLMFRKIYFSVVNAIGFIPLANGYFGEIDRSIQKSAIQLLLFQLTSHLFIFIFFNDILCNVLWLLLPFTGLFLNRLLAQSQHIGLHRFGVQGPLHHSRSIRLPPVLTFLYAGMNYHVEHHLLPSIPYYNLPKFSLFLINNSDHHLDDWIPFFSKDLWRHVRLLS